MGGNESTPGNQDKEQTPKVNHPRFQNIRFTRKDDQDCIEVKLPVANMKEYNQWVQQLKDVPSEQENFLLPLRHDFQKEGFCGSTGFVNILYQNFPYVLADQIRNRACLKQKFFDEPQLWYLIYTLITAGHQFHKSGRKVGDVRPQNVFINEDGQVKVATQLTWPSQNTNYHKTFYQKQLTYLAPEELKDIQFGKMEPSCNQKLAQSFSIGLTCLDAGTLSHSHQLYSKNNQFNYQQLPKRLSELQSAGYSQVLCLVVSNLCQPDCDKRSTCSQLAAWLQPYAQHIINLEKFQVNSLPEKISGGYTDYSSSAQRPGPQTLVGSVNQPGVQNVQQFTHTGKPDQAYLNSNGVEYHYSLPPQSYIQQGTHYISQQPAIITSNVQQAGHQSFPTHTIIQSQTPNTQVQAGQTLNIQPGQPIAIQPGQTIQARQVIYTNLPPGMQLPPQGTVTVVPQPGYSIPGPQQLPGQSPLQPSLQANQQQGSSSSSQAQTQVKTTTSTYTYSQQPQIGGYTTSVTKSEFPSQNVQYTRSVVPPATSYQSTGYQGASGTTTSGLTTTPNAGTTVNTGVSGDRQKSTMELTLEKIDEQLQMSRKMFPS